MNSAKLPSIMLLGLMALSQSLPASAHFIWLEQADGQTKLYFGEYEGALSMRLSVEKGSGVGIAVVVGECALPVKLARGEAAFIAIATRNKEIHAAAIR